MGSKAFIIMMAGLMAAVALSIDAMLPALHLIGADLNAVNANQTQYIVIMIFAGMALGQLMGGPLSDALGRKRILYIGLGIYIVGSVICIAAPSMAVMLLGRFVQGLGVAGPYISAVAIIRDRHSGAEMARLMSFVMMIFILVPSIAPGMGQAILFVADWRWIFAALLVYALVLLIWIYTKLPETLPPEKRLRPRVLDLAMGFREVFTNRVTTGYMLAMGLTFGGFMGYLNSTRQIFQDLFETGVWFSAYFGGLALIFGVASFCNATMVRHFGMRRLCQSAALAIAVSSGIFLLYAFAAVPTLWAFLAYVAILYFAMGLMFGNLNAIAMEPMGHVAGIASAVIGATSSVISLSLGTMIGQLYDGTIIPVTAGFAVLSTLCWLVMRGTDRATAALAHTG